MRHLAYPTTVANQSLGQPRQLAPAMTKTIPFDYVFQFKLDGRAKNKVQDVVEISMEGVFVALSVGYSLVLDEQKRPRAFPPVFNQQTAPQVPVPVPYFSIPLSNFPAGFIVAGMPEAEVAILNLTEGPQPSVARTAKIGPDGITEVDLSSVINAGITLRVWDRTNSLLSQIFDVGSSTPFPVTPVIGPDPTTRKLPAAGDTTVFVYGSQAIGGTDSTVNVFILEGTTGNILPVRRIEDGGTSDTFSLPSEMTFGRSTSRARVPLRIGSEDPLVDKPLSPGDVLLVRSLVSVGNGDGPIGDPLSMFTIPRPRLSNITLGALTAGLERVGADLTRGLRLNPNFANLAVADPPLDQLTPETLGRIFETGCVAAEEVSFLYSLDVTGTGREYQNKAIHNIAGLGIANGDRPFRPFAKPVMFEPRSFIRIQVEEISGPPGTLFIVLQGYKILGTGRMPG